MSIDHETLMSWLTRLKLTAIRDQLDNLLDEASRRELPARSAGVAMRAPVDDGSDAAGNSGSGVVMIAVPAGTISATGGTHTTAKRQ
jgi:hypothetical protein